MHYIFFIFLKHWPFSISFGSTGAGFEGRMQEIGSGGGGVVSARYAGVTGGCGRMDPFSWLLQGTFAVQKEKCQIVVSLTRANFPKFTTVHLWGVVLIWEPQRPLLLG